MIRDRVRILYLLFLCLYVGESTDTIPVVFNSFKMVQLIVEIVFYAETEHRK